MGIQKEGMRKYQTEKEKRRKKRKKDKKYVDTREKVWYIKVAVCKKKQEAANDL